VPSLWLDGIPEGPRLYETAAIATYLDGHLNPDSYDDGSLLLTDDLTSNASVQQWMSVHSSYFKPAMHPLYFEQVLKKRYNGGEPDEAVVAKSRLETGKVLDVLEETLNHAHTSESGVSSVSDQYIVGSRFSLADIYFAPEFEILRKIAPDLLEKSVRPNLAAWSSLVSVRPSWADNMEQWQNFEAFKV